METLTPAKQLVPLPEAFGSLKFPTIVVDPPWRYQNWTDKKNGAASSHYHCMKLEEICAVPVGDVAAKNCALLLWITHPKLAESVHTTVMDAWGFRPVTTAFDWVKTYRNGRPYCGLGFYTRSGSELCLLGVTGSLSRKSTSVRQVITAPRLGHSEKPEEVYERIEELFPGPYLEVFARRPRPGWHIWGEQVGPWFEECTEGEAS